MRNLMTAILFLCFTFCYGQYNYGLEVEQQDAKIDGKLVLGNSSDLNVFIGIDAGINTATGIGNTSIGYKSSVNNSVANYNTTIGARAGEKNTGFVNTIIGGLSGPNITTGLANTLVGYFAGNKLVTGESNVMIGRAAGLRNTSGIENIFIGNYAGSTELGSNKLYIESERDEGPLIYGEFDNDLVKINGTLHISETAKLEPQSGPPSSCTSVAEYGLMYYDNSITPNKLKLCSDTGWNDLN